MREETKKITANEINKAIELLKSQTSKIDTDVAGIMYCEDCKYTHYLYHGLERNEGHFGILSP